MPALPSPGQVVRLDFSYHNEDAQATNVMFFAYTGAGPVSISELTAFMTSSAMESDLAAPYVGASPTTETGDTTVFTDLSSSMGAVTSRADTWIGTNTGEVLPASASVVVSDTILRRYRGGHPRTYMMCGCATDFETSSIRIWQPAFLANIQAGWDAFMAAFPLTIGSRTWTPVNVSYYETVGGVRTVRATPLVDLIVAKVVKTRVSSQRRRLGKVGG